MRLILLLLSRAVLLREGRRSGRSCCAGFSLIEVLIVLGIMGIVSAFIFPSFWQFQDQGLKDISKNDLYDRAQRLGIFVGEELKMAGFMVGRVFNPDININGTTYATSILVTDNSNADDSITFIKGESIFPKVTVVATSAGLPQTATVCPAYDVLSGLSSSEKRAKLGLAGGTVYDNLVFENQKRPYRILDDAGNNGVTFGAIVNAGQAPCNAAVKSQVTTINLAEGLQDAVSSGSELLTVRLRQISIVSAGDESQLRYSDGSLNEILDRQIDGLQFEYFVNGAWVTSPGSTDAIRAVRYYILVRALRGEKGLTNTVDYTPSMGPGVTANRYGPYNDNFRRLVLVDQVEVKNYVSR